MLLHKTILYCQRIADHLARYESQYAAFAEDIMFQDACCMCVIQIGELASQLSEDVRKGNPHVPWRVIKDTRNFYVHAYGAIDLPAVWDTLIYDIPALKAQCEAILQAQYT